MSRHQFSLPTITVTAREKEVQRRASAHQESHVMIRTADTGTETVMIAYCLHDFEFVLDFSQLWAMIDLITLEVSRVLL